MIMGDDEEERKLNEEIWKESVVTKTNLEVGDFCGSYFQANYGTCGQGLKCVQTSDFQEAPYRCIPKDIYPSKQEIIFRTTERLIVQ